MNHLGDLLFSMVCMFLFNFRKWSRLWKGRGHVGLSLAPSVQSGDRLEAGDGGRLRVAYRDNCLPDSLLPAHIMLIPCWQVRDPHGSRFWFQLHISLGVVLKRPAYCVCCSTFRTDVTSVRLTKALPLGPQGLAMDHHIPSTLPSSLNVLMATWDHEVFRFWTVFPCLVNQEIMNHVVLWHSLSKLRLSLSIQ